jgi:hypothetical protein
VERAGGGRLADPLADLGGRHRAFQQEGLKERDADRVGEGAQRPGVGELADALQRIGRALRPGIVESHISIIVSREKFVKRLLSRGSGLPVRARPGFLAGWRDDLDRTDAQTGRRADDRR